KTGTLTKGILEVEAIQPVNGMKKEELLMYAASAEQESSQQAVVNNHDVKIGRASFVSVEEIETSETAIYVAIDQSFAGTILFSDQIRSEAAKTIKELRNLGVKNLMMITGDGSAIAQSIAEEVKLDSVHAHCLPQDKLTILEHIPKDQRPVAMIGDGVNDAPALAAAD
ncbi:HAD-IC family P-type ATPase, partial [Enterococcus lactis]|uniref:HAD-IC family P-type ATPase n=1 Tax=Enterococcus lactis TaxID=357441 RepID=UPI0022E3094B